MDEEICEVILSSEEQRKIIKDILDVGLTGSLHPMKFIIALVQAFKIICEETNIKYDEVLAIMQDTEEDYLN